jgi:hypothetical protein
MPVEAVQVVPAAAPTQQIQVVPGVVAVAPQLRLRPASAELFHLLIRF